MMIDPRRLAVLKLQLEILQDEIGANHYPDVDAALKDARDQIDTVSEALGGHGLLLQVTAKEPPPAVGEPVRNRTRARAGGDVRVTAVAASETSKATRLQIPHDYEPPHIEKKGK